MAFSLTNPLGSPGLGAAVGDLFSAAGDQAEGQAYAQAATLATENAELEKQSTAIQEQQASRQIYQSLGATSAEVAGAGFSAGGSNAAILRSSAQQGNLQKQLLQVQGNINYNSYKAAAEAYTGQKDAAYAAQNASTATGILGIVGSFFGT